MYSKFILLTLTLTSIIFSGCNNAKYSIIHEKNKTGVINQDGYVIVKPTYKHIFNFDSRDKTISTENMLKLDWLSSKDTKLYAIVQSTNNKFGVINQDGELLLKPIYDSLTYFFDGFMRVEVGGNFGLVDSNFQIVLKPIYTSVTEFTGDIAIVEHKGHYGCINKKMELKIKPSYQNIYFQQEDFLRTRLNGKWGYLDNKCNVLAKPIYDYAYNFSNGIAKVILNGKVGYINSKGQILSKQIFGTQSSSF